VRSPLWLAVFAYLCRPSLCIIVISNTSVREWFVNTLVWLSLWLAVCFLYCRPLLRFAKVKYFFAVTLVTCILLFGRPLRCLCVEVASGLILTHEVNIFLCGHPCGVHFVVWQAFALSLCGSGLGLNPYTRGRPLSTVAMPLWWLFGERNLQDVSFALWQFVSPKYCMKARCGVSIEAAMTACLSNNRERCVVI
jgi:hypothetical protein